MRYPLSVYLYGAACGLVFVGQCLAFVVVAGGVCAVQEARRRLRGIVGVM